MEKRKGKCALSRAQLNIVTTLANQLVTTACGVVVPHLLLTSFGSEAYGITVSITQFLSYISLLESGIGGVARGRLYGPLARGDEREISLVFYAVKQFFLYVAAAFVIYSAALGLGYYDLAHVTLFSRGYIFALVLVIGISTLAKYMGGLANLTLIVADQRQYVNNFITMFTTVANTLLIILLIRLKTDLIWVKLGSSLIFVVRPVLYILYVRQHYRLRKVPGEKAVLEQKWTGIGQHIAYFLHSNTDVVLLTVLAGPTYVAVYSVYNLVISSIRAITEAFSGGMEAAFGEMIAKGETRRLQKSYRNYKRLLTAVTVVLFGCAGILILSFVRLYTEDVKDVSYFYPAFSVVLLLSEAVNCLVLPCSALPVAANHLRQTRWGAYGEAIINIGLSCLLIQWNPLLGVAVGTLAATMFRGMFYILYSARYILALSPAKLLAEFFGTIGLLLAVILGGRYFIERIAIYSYLTWSFCGAAVFLALAVPTALIFYRRTERQGGKA